MERSNETPMERSKETPIERSNETPTGTSRSQHAGRLTSLCLREAFAKKVVVVNSNGCNNIVSFSDEKLLFLNEYPQSIKS